MIVLTEGEYTWAMPLVGSWLFIFAIHFSPTLRHFLSYPSFVFLGSISFGMYLIHGFLMRSTLVWIIYGFLPETEGWVRRVGGHGQLSEHRFRLVWDILNSIIFILWMFPLVYLSKLWRDRVDPFCIKFAQWGEQVLLGKREFSKTVTAIGYNVVSLVQHGQLTVHVLEKGTKE
jgi:hypothetical protein